MYNRILAPLDGSKLSECSLRHIIEIATGCHVSEVVLLTALEDISPVYSKYGSRSQIEAEIQDREKERRQIRETADKYLDEAKEKLSEKGVVAQYTLVQPEEHKSPADIILEYAESNNIDLIVMSTHGRSGITRWAFGSVADRVVRHSKIPVLLVAPPGCRV